MEETSEKKNKMFYVQRARTKIAQIAANKVNSFSPDTPIYYYGGHGVDVCDPYKHEPIIDIVPDNCIYITLTECGNYSYLNDIMQGLFYDSSEHGRALLRYPYLFENLLEISKRTLIPLRNFHIHFPGTKYVVSNFEPLASFDTSQEIMVTVSGLSEKTLMEKESKQISLTSLQKQDMSFTKLNRNLTKTQVFDILKRGIKTEQKFMRSVVDSSYPEIVWGELFPERESIEGEEIQKFFESCFFVLRKETVLNKFSASVFPTKKQVEDILEINFPNHEYFNKIQMRKLAQLILIKLNGSHKNIYRNQSASTTNRSMMQKFPGIHYNIVCRSVAPECLPQATLHRRGSFNRETVRREVLTVRRPEQLYFYNKIKLENSKNTKEYLDFFEKHRIRIGQLPEVEKNKLINKLSYLRPISVENLVVFYEILFPYEEKYRPSDIRYEISSAPTKIEFLLNKNNFFKFEEELMSRFLDRIDTEYIEKMSNKEKQEELNKLIELIRAKIESELLEERVKKLLSPKEEKNSPLFTQIIGKLKNILDRDYPKAKNLKDLLRTKQIAIYNNLLGIKDRLLSLNDLETKKLIDFLQGQKIIEGDELIVKKIKHLIRPTNYANPLLRSSGGTRKQKKGRVNKTRKH